MSYLVCHSDRRITFSETLPEASPEATVYERMEEMKISGPRTTEAKRPRTDDEVTLSHREKQEKLRQLRELLPNAMQYLRDEDYQQIAALSELMAERKRVFLMQDNPAYLRLVEALREKRLLFLRTWYRGQPAWNLIRSIDLPRGTMQVLDVGAIGAKKREELFVWDGETWSPLAEDTPTPAIIQTRLGSSTMILLENKPYDRWVTYVDIWHAIDTEPLPSENELQKIVVGPKANRDLITRYG